MEVGLYDSETGDSLSAEKVVDVSEFQDEGLESSLVFTRAKRGRIVQLHCGALVIHYFLDEPRGRKMIDEDSERFGFGRGLLALADKNAPTGAHG